MLIVTRQGRNAVLSSFFAGFVPPAGGQVIYRLFTNTLATYDDEVIAGSLIEAVGGGYAPVTVEYADMAVGDDSVVIDPVIFQFTGPLTGGVGVNGYYATNSSGMLLWYEPITLFTPAADGEYIEVNTTLQISN